MAAWNSFWGPQPGTGTFDDKRNTRYDTYWSLYWNTVYDTLSDYLKLYPPGSRLYKYTRGLRNPIGRWIDFYVANIWGGTLDHMAGDGKNSASSIPIITDNERLRPAIAKVWQWSNWNTRRQLATMHSATLGDAFIKVVDNPASGKVYLQVRWPGEFSEVEWDDFGHVKKAVIEYQTKDDSGNIFQYREVIEHPRVWGGATTRFSTYKDGRPFAYDENTQAGQKTWQWTAPYDFVPVVNIPFIDVGAGWGATGYVKTLRKIDAANALASQIADQIGKTVNTPLVVYGVQSGDVTVTESQDGIPMLFVPRPPSEAAIDPLISNMDLSAALAVLNAQLDDITQDLPELRLSEALRSGMSGEALGRAFADVVQQIQAVRANHDSALIRAHQMAVTIGGMSRYDPAFQGFDLTSFKAGRLDHAVGTRPVLPKSSDEELAEEAQRWTMAQQAIAAGVPVDTAVREIVGWDESQMAAMAADQQAEFVTDNEQ